MLNSDEAMRARQRQCLPRHLVRLALDVCRVAAVLQGHPDRCADDCGGEKLFGALSIHLTTATLDSLKQELSKSVKLRKRKAIGKRR